MFLTYGGRGVLFLAKSPRVDRIVPKQATSSPPPPKNKKPVAISASSETIISFNGNRYARYPW